MGVQTRSVYTVVYKRVHKSVHIYQLPIQNQPFEVYTVTNRAFCSVVTNSIAAIWKKNGQVYCE